MNRIDTSFKTWKRAGHKALIPFFTAGYPDRGTTVALLLAAAEAGADLLEVGIPFSDPLADGPVIQATSFESLRRGTRLQDAFTIASEFRRRSDVPLVFMTYYNPVHRLGVSRFITEAKRAGTDGLIVADLIPEEGATMGRTCREAGLDLIYLCAPTSPRERIRTIARASTGFVYLVSLRGVTGARTALPSDLARFAARVRRETDKPLCVGFGIGTPAHAATAARLADGVIVGSALLREIGAAGSPGRAVKRAKGFLRSLRKAIP